MMKMMKITESLNDFYLSDETTDVGDFIPYTRQQALEDLFIEENKFDRIVSTLKRKKNIVLQGST